MLEFQQEFQDLITVIKTLLAQAQAAGKIEKYRLEVIFSTPTQASSLKNGHDEDLYNNFYSLLQMVEKIVTRFCTAPSCSKGVTCLESTSSEYLSKEENQYHWGKGTSEHDNHGNQTFTHSSVLDSSSHGLHQNGYITHLGQVDRCQIENENSLSPQQPTTKETEAANVLMNLSGKAAERISHTRVDACIHSQELTCLDGRSAVFFLPTGSGSIKWDLAAKRDSHLSDEVPQINEKDLLPLATQVLCQFCSRQCEDLVELHEHVLSMHNVPDSELPLMPSTRKVKNFCETEGETREQMPNYVIQKENISNYHIKSLKNEEPSKFGSEVQGLTNSKANRGKQKSVYSVSFENSRDPGDYTQPTDDHNKYTIEIKTVHNFPGVDIQSLQPMEQDLQSFTTSIKNERQMQNVDNNCLENVHLQSEVTELKPIKSDALALAVESSQIKVIEAKVTFYVCLMCSSCYTHTHDFKNHVCNGEKPFIQKCADGSIVLLNSSNSSENHLQPPDCNVWFFPEFYIRRTFDGMKQNLEIIHCSSGRKLLLHTSYQPSYLSEQFISFRCPTCENDIDSLGRFFDHLVAGPCMFRCPECSLVYVTQEKLQNHRSSLHPSVEDRTCPNCHKVFEKRHERNKHLKTKCSINHFCNICGNVLKNEYNLQVHMQSHKERNHVCNECGAAFHRRAILLRHMMRHSGNRPHACHLCSAKFFTRQHLRTHVDRHNCIKRHKCGLCKKAYYSKHDLENHYSKVHSRSAAGQNLPRNQEEKLTDVPMVE